MTVLLVVCWSALSNPTLPDNASTATNTAFDVIPLDVARLASEPGPGQPCKSTGAGFAKQDGPQGLAENFTTLYLRLQQVRYNSWQLVNAQLMANRPVFLESRSPRSPPQFSWNSIILVS